MKTTAKSILQSIMYIYGIALVSISTQRTTVDNSVDGKHHKVN